MFNLHHKVSERRIKEQDVIFLPELMMRWSYLYYIKIIKEINSKRLTPYVVNRAYNNATENCFYYIIDKIPLEDWRINTFLLFFRFICFRKKVIHTIEQKKEHYLDIQIFPKKFFNFDLCTRTNINNIAPVFACVLSKYTKNDKENLKIDNINEYMRSLKHDANIEMEFQYSDANLDFIPDKEIFYEASTYGNLNIKKEKIDIKIIEKRLVELKKQGITNRYELACLLDHYFPDSLSHRELGRLLPAYPESKIEPNSYKKTGQRLREYNKKHAPFLSTQLSTL